MKAQPEGEDFVVILNDRLKSIKSKLIKIGQDGATKYSVTNTFTRPVSLNIAENNFYYVTDLTGQYGKIFFRSFTQDGAGSSGGNSGGSGGTGGTGGGNAGGGTGGDGGTGGGAG